MHCAVFRPDGDVFFVAGERGAQFLYRINDDGSGLGKVVPNPVTFLYGVSADELVVKEAG